MADNEKVSEEQALQLMRNYGGIIDELCDRGVCRTESQPTGGYAEWLVSRKLNLEFAKNPTQSGYDLINPVDKTTYQVKSRRLHKSHSYKISVSKYDKYHFDYLIILLFNKDFSIKKTYKIPYATVPKIFKPSGKNKNMEVSIKLIDYEKLKVDDSVEILNL